MEQKSNIIWVGVLIAMVIATGALVQTFRLGSAVQDKFGAVTGVSNYDKLGLSQLKVGVGCNSSFSYAGCSGTAFNGILAGACTIWAPSNTIGATSTQQAVCQSATNGSLASGLTGVTTDAICSVRSASSTNTTVGGIAVEGTSASSTAGSIVVQLANFTGTTFTWSAAASSSSQWNYTCFDPA